MPLPVLLLLVVGGIAGIAVLLHILGLSAPRRFISEADAKQAWLREFPLTKIRQVTLAQNASAAIIETSDGVGVVWPMGADSTARMVSGSQIRTTKSGLDVRLGDFTAPALRLDLPQDEAAKWHATLKDMT